MEVEMGVTVERSNVRWVHGCLNRVTSDSSVVPPVVGQREHNRQRDEDAQCECRSEERACDPQQRDHQLNTETPHNVASLADCRLFCDVSMVRDEHTPASVDVHAARLAPYIASATGARA